MKCLRKIKNYAAWKIIMNKLYKGNEVIIQN